MCPGSDALSSRVLDDCGQFWRSGELIGSGATATVHVAIADSGPAFDRVIKRLLPTRARDGRAHEAFATEAALLARSRLPGAPALVGSSLAAPFPFLLLERVQGRDLRSFPSPPVWGAVLGRLLGPVARTVAALHDAGFVHGDIKPANIVRAPDGAGRLIDFGAARPIPLGALDPAPLRRDHCRARRATPAFAPPELLAGEEADRRDDVFALAMVAVTLLTGVRAAGPDRSDALSAAAQAGRLSTRGRAALEAALSPDRAGRPDDPVALVAQIAEAPARWPAARWFLNHVGRGFIA